MIAANVWQNRPIIMFRQVKKKLKLMNNVHPESTHQLIKFSLITQLDAPNILRKLSASFFSCYIFREWNVVFDISTNNI